MREEVSKFYDESDERDLLQATAVLVLDGEKYMLSLAVHGIDDCVPEGETGLFLPWSNKPFLPDGVYYPIDRVGDDTAAITDMDTVVKTKVPLINPAYPSRVIGPKMISKYRRLLSSSPPVNMPMMDLLMGYVVEIIDSTAPVNKYHTNRFPKVVNALKSDRVSRTVYDLLEASLDDLFLTVRSFIGADKWHIYDIKRSGNNIIIEKLIDYRIFDWYRIQRERAEVDE